MGLTAIAVVSGVRGRRTVSSDAGVVVVAFTALSRKSVEMRVRQEWYVYILESCPNEPYSLRSATRPSFCFFVKIIFST